MLNSPPQIDWSKYGKRGITKTPPVIDWSKYGEPIKFAPGLAPQAEPVSPPEMTTAPALSTRVEQPIAPFLSTPEFRATEGILTRELMPEEERKVTEEWYKEKFAPYQPSKRMDRFADIASFGAFALLFGPVAAQGQLERTGIQAVEPILKSFGGTGILNKLPATVLKGAKVGGFSGFLKAYLQQPGYIPTEDTIKKTFGEALGGAIWYGLGLGGKAVGQKLTKELVTTFGKPWTVTLTKEKIRAMHGAQAIRVKHDIPNYVKVAGQIWKTGKPQKITVSPGTEAKLVDKAWWKAVKEKWGLKPFERIVQVAKPTAKAKETVVARGLLPEKATGIPIAEAPKIKVTPPTVKPTGVAKKIVEPTARKVPESLASHFKGRLSTIKIKAEGYKAKEDFWQFGIARTLSKKGTALDLAEAYEEALETGLIAPVPAGEHPSGYFLRLLQGQAKTVAKEIDMTDAEIIKLSAERRNHYAKLTPEEKQVLANGGKGRQADAEVEAYEDFAKFVDRESAKFKAEEKGVLKLTSEEVAKAKAKPLTQQELLKVRPEVPTTKISAKGIAPEAEVKGLPMFEKKAPPQPKLGLEKAKAEKVAKEPWEMTREEFRKSGFVKFKEATIPFDWGRKYRIGQELDKIRYRSIQNAIKEGKPIPPEVLKDYPDLAKQVKVGVTPAEKIAKPEAKPIPKEFEPYAKDYAKTISDLKKWTAILPSNVKDKAILFGSVSDEKLYKQSFLARKTGKKASDVDIYLKDYDALSDVKGGIRSFDLGEAKEYGLTPFAKSKMDEFTLTAIPDRLGYEQLLPKEEFVKKVKPFIGNKMVDLFVEIDGVLHQYHYDHDIKRNVFSPVGYFDKGQYDEKFATEIKKTAIDSGKPLKSFWQVAQRGKVAPTGKLVGVYRITGETKVMTTDKKIAKLRIGDEYRVYRVAGRKLRITDGDQFTIETNQLKRIHGVKLRPGEMKAGGIVHPAEGEDPLFRKKQKLIHMWIREENYPEERYRAILKNATGIESTKDMTPEQMDKAYYAIAKVLNKKGPWMPKLETTYYTPVQKIESTGEKVLDYRFHTFAKGELQKESELLHKRAKPSDKPYKIGFFRSTGWNLADVMADAENKTGLPAFQLADKLIHGYQLVEYKTGMTEAVADPLIMKITEADRDEITKALEGKLHHLSEDGKKLAQDFRQWYDKNKFDIKKSRFIEQYEGKGKIPNLKQEKFDELVKIFETEGEESLDKAIAKTNFGVLSKFYSPRKLKRYDITLPKPKYPSKSWLKTRKARTEQVEYLTDAVEIWRKTVRGLNRIKYIQENLVEFRSMLNDPKLDRVAAGYLNAWADVIAGFPLPRTHLGRFANWGISSIIRTALVQPVKWVRNWPQRFFLLGYTRTLDWPKTLYRTLRHTAPPKFNSQNPEAKVFAQYTSQLEAIEREFLETQKKIWIDKLPVIGRMLRIFEPVYPWVDNGSRWANYSTILKNINDALKTNKPFVKLKNRIYWDYLPLPLKQKLLTELDMGNKEYFARRIAEEITGARTQFLYRLTQKTLAESKTELGRVGMRVMAFTRQYIGNMVKDGNLLVRGKTFAERKSGARALVWRIVLSSLIIERALNALWGEPRSKRYGFGYKLSQIMEVDFFGIGKTAFDWGAQPISPIMTVIISAGDACRRYAVAQATGEEVDLDDLTKAIDKASQSLVRQADSFTLSTIPFLRQSIFIMEALVGTKRVKPLMLAYKAIIKKNGWDYERIERMTLDKIRHAMAGTEGKQPEKIRRIPLKPIKPIRPKR